MRVDTTLAPFQKQSGIVGRLQTALVAEHCTGIHKYFKNDYGDIYAFWDSSGRGQWFFSEKHMHQVAQEFIVRFSTGIPQSWKNEWDNVGDEIKKCAWEIHKLPRESIPQEVLIHFFNTILGLHARLWAVSIFIDTFDAGDDKLEIERLQSVFECSDADTNVLLTPCVLSYTSAWRQSVHNVAAGVQAFEDVHKDFFWIRTDYLQFQELTKEYLLSVSEAPQDTTVLLSLEEGQSVLVKYGLTENPFSVWQLLAQWRDERKRLNFTALYGIMRILSECARRNNIPEELVRNCMPNDARLLCGGTTPNDFADMLSSRTHIDTFAHFENTGAYTFVEGDDAYKYFLLLEEQENVIQDGVLRGAVASRGIAMGRVRIVIDPYGNDAKDFMSGDILVTPMTRPEFLPLMHLASGIITDEGGITSHAAIASRELKKPCVIGTKNATRVLQNGQHVVVDGEKGIVRLTQKD